VTPEHLGTTVQEVTPGQLGATVQEMAPGNWEPPTRGDSHAQADAASTFKSQ